MNNIILKTLVIRNFKGIKELTINFSNHLTSILGDNATGKTTILDAFIWLFFSKDSENRKEFDIKNTKYPELNRQDCEVSATISKNDILMEVKHLYHEKWTKKRGQQFAEMTGHEHLYFWNNIPVKETEYKEKIESHLLSEEVFRLVTNTGYFCSLPWKHQRSILIDMAGGLSDSDIIANNKEFKVLLDHLSNKTIEEYKREIAIRKKKIKEELELIPARIDEVQRSTPEPEDFESIRQEITNQQKKLSDTESMITNRSKTHDLQYATIQQRQDEIYRLKTRLSELEYTTRDILQRSLKEIQLKKSVITELIKTTTQIIQSKKKQLSATQKLREDLESRIGNMRSLWVQTKSREIEFNQHEFTCPACRRTLDPADIETKKNELADNFNQDKERALQEIEKKAAEIKTEAGEYDRTISALEQTLNDLDQTLYTAQQDLQVLERSITSGTTETAEDILQKDHEYVRTKSQLEELEAVHETIPPIDLTLLNTEKSEITSRIDELKRRLRNKDYIDRANNRLTDLQKEEGILTQELATFEETEFLIDKFNKYKLDSIEESINSMFSYVRFKLFDRQINGAEVETCEVIHDGVPYSVLNNAARINSGLDIIRTISEYYGISAPCFIDNAESITYLLPVESQLIRLVVSEQDKQLKVA